MKILELMITQDGYAWKKWEMENIKQTWLGVMVLNDIKDSTWLFDNANNIAEY